MKARQSTAVAIGGRAVLIEGPPGCGKSSLALALIDRGAQLIGDDSLCLAVAEKQLIAAPHPGTRNLMEVRNLGLVRMRACPSAPACLLVLLDPDAPRFIERPGTIAVEGISLPLVRLDPSGANLALKTELALQQFGLVARPDLQP